jgi:PAS domain S-box-containing protein
VANFSPRLLQRNGDRHWRLDRRHRGDQGRAGGLPAQMPPIVMVQHMPETFTPSFAKRLDSLSKLTVIEAQGGERLKPGMAYLAPGHSHMRVRKCRRLRAGTVQDEPVNRHRPAADVLFHSLAEHLGKRALGMILTGMGKDGAQGLLAMRRAGAWNIGQDQASCVVYGMPREAALAGALDEVALRQSRGFVIGSGLNETFAESPFARWMEIIHPDDRARAIADFRAADPGFESEYRVRRDSGEWAWLNIRGRVIERDTDGKARRSTGTVFDITARRQAELLLQIQHDFAGLLLMQPDQASLFRAILDSSLRLPGLDGGGLYWRQADGGYGLVAHHGFSDQFITAIGDLPVGSPQAEIIRSGQLVCSCSKVDSHCNRPELVQAPSLVAEGIRALVVLPIMVDGEALACLNLASRSQSSTPVTTVTALETLTRQFAQGLARQRAAESAAERERNITGLFGALDDYIFVVAHDGRVLHYNAAVSDRLGYGQSLLGRPLIEVHPPEMRGEAARIIGDILAGRIASCPLPILKADGSQIQVDTRIVHGSWNGQAAIFGVSRDITRQLKQEAALGEAMQFSADLINSCRESTS